MNQVVTTGLEETSTAEETPMPEPVRPLIDTTRFWTTVMVAFVVALGSFLVTNWALPSKVSVISADIKTLSTSLSTLKESQVTKADLKDAMEASHEYTDSQIKLANAEMKVTTAQILTNQTNFKDDVDEIKASNLLLTSTLTNISMEVSKISFAVESVK